MTPGELDEFQKAATRVCEPVHFPCYKSGFTALMYAAALTRLPRYDGMCIKAHPVMASLIRYVIDAEPFRLPVVPDSRNRTDQVEIWDLRSTCTPVLLFEGLALPPAAPQCEGMEVLPSVI